MSAAVRRRIFFPSGLLTKNMEIKVYRTITFVIVVVVVVLYGCETWSVTLRVFEKRVLGRYLGLRVESNRRLEKIA